MTMGDESTCSMNDRAVVCLCIFVSVFVRAGMGIRGLSNGRNNRVGILSLRTHWIDRDEGWYACHGSVPNQICV